MTESTDPARLTDRVGRVTAATQGGFSSRDASGEGGYAIPQNSFLLALFDEDEMLPLDVTSYPSVAGKGLSAQARSAWIDLQDSATNQRLGWTLRENLWHVTGSSVSLQFSSFGFVGGPGVEGALLLPENRFLQMIFGVPGYTPGPGDYQPVERLTPPPFAGFTFEFDYRAASSGVSSIFANVATTRTSPGLFRAAYFDAGVQSDYAYANFTADPSTYEGWEDDPYAETPLSPTIRDNAGEWIRYSMTVDPASDKAWLHLNGKRVIEATGQTAGFPADIDNVETVELAVQSNRDPDVSMLGYCRFSWLPLYDGDDYTPRSLLNTPPPTVPAAP